MHRWMDVYLRACMNAGARALTERCPAARPCSKDSGNVRLLEEVREHRHSEAWSETEGPLGAVLLS